MRMETDVLTTRWFEKKGMKSELVTCERGMVNTGFFFGD